MKDKKLNAELKELEETLGKDLWLKQPAAIKYMYYILMACSKTSIITGALGLIVLLLVCFCTFNKSEWAFPLMCVESVLFGMIISINSRVLRGWHKFPKTGKMPDFGVPWEQTEE